MAADDDALGLEVPHPPLIEAEVDQGEEEGELDGPEFEQGDVQVAVVHDGAGGDFPAVAKIVRLGDDAVEKVRGDRLRLERARFIEPLVELERFPVARCSEELPGGKKVSPDAHDGAAELFPGHPGRCPDAGERGDAALDLHEVDRPGDAFGQIVDRPERVFGDGEGLPEGVAAAERDDSEEDVVLLAGQEDPLERVGDRPVPAHGHDDVGVLAGGDGPFHGRLHVAEAVVDLAGELFMQIGAEELPSHPLGVRRPRIDETGGLEVGLRFRHGPDGSVITPRDSSMYSMRVKSCQKRPGAGHTFAARNHDLLIGVQSAAQYYYGEQQIDYLILSAPRVLAGQ